MNSAMQIKKCKKCGIHYIYSKNAGMRDEANYCHECRVDKFSSSAVLFARVIEKMLRE